MNSDLKLLVDRIKRRAYLDSDEVIGQWITDYAKNENKLNSNELDNLRAILDFVKTDIQVTIDRIKSKELTSLKNE